MSPPPPANAATTPRFPRVSGDEPAQELLGDLA